MAETGPTERFGVGWHLDKRLPLALILAIVVQTGTGVWFAAGLHFRLAALENRKDLNDRMVRLEQVVTTNTRTLERMEHSLDRLRFSSSRRLRDNAVSPKIFTPALGPRDTGKIEKEG